MSRILLMLAALCLYSAAARADGPEVPPSPRLSTTQILAQEVFPRLDANHDGLITKPEYEAALPRAFGAWDRNGDRRLSGAEAPIFELLTVGDRDGDGLLEPREFARTMWRLFRLMDVNDDDQVTGGEWRAAAIPGDPAQPSERGQPR